MATEYEPRIMVRHKKDDRYVLWLYEAKDWEEGNTYYTDNWEIVAWAHSSEERNRLSETIEYRKQLMEEIENANN